MQHISNHWCREMFIWGFFFLLHLVAVASRATADWYYDNWCGGSLQYLDDHFCAKIFPAISSNSATARSSSSSYRDWQCPIVSPSGSVPPTADGYQIDGTALNEVVVDTTALAGILDDESNSGVEINLCVILTQRVQNASEDRGFSMYNKYLCAGNASATEAYETWSSSKVFAMANAAGRLRSNESSCARRLFGLDGAVAGKDSEHTPLGDLATVIASYDSTAGYSSNSLSSYMHDLGFRQRIHDLVDDSATATATATIATNDSINTKSSSSGIVGGWLGVPGQSLGGNYGEATPTDLGFEVTAATPDVALDTATSAVDTATAVSAVDTATAVTAASCAADVDPWPVVYPNSLSALAAAEMTRRLVLHREVSPQQQFPGTQWRDVQSILYGADESVLFPGQQWGGMTADTAVFVQSALNLPQLLQNWGVNAHGPDQWRIFSKLGAGFANSLYQADIISNSYVCLPHYNVATDATTATATGVEFTIAARVSVPDDVTLEKADSQLYAAIEQAVQYVLKDTPRTSTFSS